MNEIKLYAFLLGSNPALSMAEVFAVLGEEHSLIGASKEVLMIESPELPKDLVDRLGGTIKVIEILSEESWRGYDPMRVAERISQAIKERSTGEGRFHLGISIYNLDSSKTKLFRLERSLKFFYINIKKISARDGIKIAFPRIKERALSSASVLHNGLLSADGAEVDIILGQDNLWVGQTIGVQNIDEYSHRDVSRPKRDLVSGTTPPKLAKIMVNLATAGKEKEASLLDPFCGSGTFIQEMKLLGFNNIWGSDISEKAVKDTAENIDWLFEGYSLVGREAIKIEKVDALELSKFYKKSSFDAIVSEVYLGPPLRQALSLEGGQKIVNELSSLYAKVLRQMSTVIKKDGQIVLALPIFKTTGGLRYLNIDDAIRAAGLEVIEPAGIIKNKFGGFVSKRKSMIYSRPDQFVQREIIALKNKA